jgi:hypothetical protein
MRSSWIIHPIHGSRLDRPKSPWMDISWISVHDPGEQILDHGPIPNPDGLQPSKPAKLSNESCYWLPGSTTNSSNAKTNNTTTTSTVVTTTTTTIIIMSQHEPVSKRQRVQLLFVAPNSQLANPLQINLGGETLPDPKPAIERPTSSNPPLLPR